MKKLLLSALVLTASGFSFSQNIFRILSPAAIEGTVEFTSPGNTADPDWTAWLDTVQVEEKIVLVDDGTAADSLGCNPLVTPLGGYVKAFTLTSGGTGYADATDVATTTTGSGTGLTVDITTVAGEVTNVVIVDEGLGYEVGDEVTISGGGGDATFDVDEIGGHIAMIYRGVCEFGQKCLRAQLEGAAAVIIVNNEENTALVNMAAGAFGGSVTIPAIFISAEDGALIREQIDLSEEVIGFIGNKLGKFDNDLNLTRGLVMVPPTYARPDFMTDDIFSFTPTAHVANIGNDDQTQMQLRCVIKHIGTDTEVYNEISTAQPINSGDTIIVALPNFDGTPYQQGFYDITYSIEYENTDEDEFDNEYNAGFWINEKYYSMTAFDSITEMPIADAYGFPGLDDAQQAQWDGSGGLFRSCIVFDEKDIDTASVYRFGFAAATVEGESLVGKLLRVTVQDFEYNFSMGGDLLSQPIIGNQIYSGFYVFESDLQEQFVEHSIGKLELDKDKNYLFCLDVDDRDVRVGYNANSSDYFLHTITNEKFNLFVGVKIGTAATQYFFRGFTGNLLPAIYLNLDYEDVLSTDEEVLAEEKLVYPNPANDFINIPLLGAVKGEAQIRLLDMSGKVVLDSQVNITSNEVRLNTASVETGRYVITVNYSDGSVRTHNIVINK